MKPSIQNHVSRAGAFVTATFLSLYASASALAEDVTRQTVNIPHTWQLNFQPAASPVMETLENMHNILLWIIFGVSILVLLIMIYIAVKFNRKANPTPSTTTHNTMLEIVWTTVPILILISIAIPSVRAHYFMEQEPTEGITLKVTGHQWYWSYEYPDHGGFGFDSYMLNDEDAKKAGEPRLLGTDNHVVVPVNTPVRVLLTGADVIHAWALPAFGVKRDAVPGRLNESWFEATKEGIYYGQCSELCGKLHGFMPIELEVVSKEKFAAWVADQQKIAGIEPVNVESEEKPASKVELITEGENDTAAPVTATKPAANKNAVIKEMAPAKDAAPKENLEF